MGTNLDLGVCPSRGFGGGRVEAGDDQSLRDISSIERRRELKVRRK